MNASMPEPDIDRDDDEAPRSAADEQEARLGELQAQLDAAVEARKRALADFANYQRRAVEEQGRAREAGATAVIRSLLPVLDHFDLALGHSADAKDPDPLAAGVRIVRDELLRALEGHGLRRIEAAPGDEFDPHRHQAVTRQATPGLAPGRIASVLQAGYALGDRVLRPAQVAVAASPQESLSDADL